MADLETFKVTVDNKECELNVRMPNGNDYNKADVIKSRVLFQSLKDGLPTMLELENILTEKGIWNEEKQLQVEEIRKQIADKEVVLSKGNMKVSKGKKIAFEIKELRSKIRELVMERGVYYNNSAEGHAENSHFNCLVSRCLVYNNTNNPYFKTLDDYNENSSTSLGIWAANKLANLTYGVGREAEKSLIENEFLLQFELVNDDLQLIDTNHHLVDMDGKRVDELGNLIDKDGNFIDIVGNARDAENRPIVDRKPFLDEKGKPIKSKKEKVDLPEVESGITDES